MGRPLYVGTSQIWRSVLQTPRSLIRFVGQSVRIRPGSTGLNQGGRDCLSVHYHLRLPSNTRRQTMFNQQQRPQQFYPGGHQFDGTGLSDDDSFGGEN